MADDRAALGLKPDEEAGRVAAALLTLEAIYGRELPAWASPRLKRAAELLRELAAPDAAQRQG